MLRHTYVTTMLDAGVDLRDVQIAARHADPRTTIDRVVTFNPCAHTELPKRVKKQARTLTPTSTT